MSVRRHIKRDSYPRLSFPFHVDFDARSLSIWFRFVHSCKHIYRIWRTTVVHCNKSCEIFVTPNAKLRQPLIFVGMFFLLLLILFNPLHWICIFFYLFVFSLSLSLISYHVPNSLAVWTTATTTAKWTTEKSDVEIIFLFYKQQINIQQTDLIGLAAIVCSKTCAFHVNAIDDRSTF